MILRVRTGWCVDRHFKEVLLLGVFPSSVLSGQIGGKFLDGCIAGPMDNWTVLLLNLLSIPEQVYERGGFER